MLSVESGEIGERSWLDSRTQGGGGFEELKSELSRSLYSYTVHPTLSGFSEPGIDDWAMLQLVHGTACTRLLPLLVHF